VFYMMMAALEDEETQKKGVVVIDYLLSNPGRLDPALIQIISSTMKALPRRVGGCHFCVTGYASRAWIALIRRFFLPKDLRLRSRVHDGELQLRAFSNRYLLLISSILLFP
jgi:hypothetical protein